MVNWREALKNVFLGASGCGAILWLFVLMFGSSSGYANMKTDTSDEDSESKPLTSSQSLLTYVLGLVFLVIVVNNFLGGKTRGSKSSRSRKK